MKGTITALITPFMGEELDEAGLAQNIRTQITAGVNGILALGSTGESPTLTPEEQKRVIRIAVREAKGKIAVWVGTGSYCTRETIAKTAHAKELGADVALIVTPYYNKPTQEGIFRHFEAITAAVDIPIMVYNIPGRCGVNIETDTLLRIAALPHIIGVKEASGRVEQAREVMERIPNFLVFSGDDILTQPMMESGASGVISVASNLVPEKVAAQVNYALEGQFDLSRAMHAELEPLYKVLFIETNPVPIKTAMALCGLPAGGCRLPLAPMNARNIEILRQLVLR